MRRRDKPHQRTMSERRPYKPPDFVTMYCPKCRVITLHRWTSVRYKTKPPVATFRCILCRSLYRSEWDGRSWPLRETPPQIKEAIRRAREELIQEELRRFHEEMLEFASKLPPPSGDPRKDLRDRMIPWHEKYQELLRKYPEVRRVTEELTRHYVEKILPARRGRPKSYWDAHWVPPPPERRVSHEEQGGPGR